MRGAPIVYVLHGLLGTAYGHFSHQIRAWEGRYRVVPVDLPGHGRCPLDAGEEYLDQAYEYLSALVTRFGPGRVVAASYLGSPLAVRCAEEMLTGGTYDAQASNLTFGELNALLA
jgi:pimeloyl-ACP methyl ester carboxylesterase